jgi:heavy metal translocating P-type ATPase
MISKLRKFFSDYSQFGLTLLAIIIALVLDLSNHDKYAHILLGFAAIANSIPLVWGMINDLREGIYGVDILAATAIIASVILGEYWAGMIIVLMLTGGEALEDYAEKRAKSELTALISRVPTKTHKLKGRKLVDVTVSSVLVNDKLVIKPGEVVPVDCQVVEGESNFDESSLTGESLPVEKKVGDQLLSGSVNIEGSVTVKTLRIAKDSQYEQIIKLVQSAGISQAPFVRLADRYAVPFTIIAFAIAGTAWAMSGEAIRFLQVLVVATPCPLILGAPIALISGMSRATKHGIIVKTGSTLEKLARIKTVGFDKTGTLTEGKPSVQTIITNGKFSQNQIISFAGALEHNSSHILAKAIINEAKNKKIKLPNARQVKETSGHGLSGKVGKNDITLGKQSYIDSLGIKIPKNIQSKLNQTASLLVVDNQLAGAIIFKDQLRSESKKTLGLLRKLGIKHTLMVTGDNQPTADKIAKEVGLTDVYANCLPADKLRAVDGVTNKPVAFVGDGVNDAPVLAMADVGIALGARGSTAASESADVVIMLDDLSKVASAVDISKRTIFIAKQSIMIGILISIALMFIFATGKFKASYGAAIQEVVDIIVIINALRAHSDKTLLT